eukprot:11176502-Lingulodinium_polyedra.AAC.1
MLLAAKSASACCCLCACCSAVPALLAAGPCSASCFLRGVGAATDEAQLDVWQPDHLSPLLAKTRLEPTCPG